METASWRDLADAILLAWQGGQEAGNSVVNVLSGKMNPSGRLASTFPLSYNDVPSSKNFPGIVLEEPKPESSPGAGRSGRGRVPSEVVYEEDIYVGYRYYGTFHVPVAYEFGYGLSYTQFEYSRPSVSSTRFTDRVTVGVDVKDTGKVTGREVVQVYLSAPAGRLDKPKEKLVAFAKTRPLQPGETQTLSFDLRAEDLTSFDEASSSWVAEAGTYQVKIGASSQDIRQTASFELDKELIVRKVNKAMTPTRQIHRLHP